MISAIRTATHSTMSDDELTKALVDRLPSDTEGPLFWA